MIEYFNPNPTCKYFKSGKPKNWYVNDSSVRALSKALNVTWDKAYDMLVNTGKKLYNMPTSKQVMEDLLFSNGFEYVTYGKPNKDDKRPNVKQFVEKLDNSDKIYILNLADYFVCVINKKVFDVSDTCLKNSVYSYWVK
jgi:hypothetical protein